MLYGDNFEKAVIRAVNDTIDNDTISAIVGAAVGALHGKSAIPSRWIENLSGRTSYDDDGKVFKIISQVKSDFIKRSGDTAGKKNLEKN